MIEAGCYMVISENRNGNIMRIPSSFSEEKSRDLFNSIKVPEGGAVRLVKIIKTKYHDTE